MHWKTNFLWFWNKHLLVVFHKQLVGIFAAFWIVSAIEKEQLEITFIKVNYHALTHMQKYDEVLYIQYARHVNAFIYLSLSVSLCLCPFVRQAFD